MIDYLQEILTTLQKNRLRAIMTGFSVAWGIFMLILLLGSGSGLQNGMENNFKGTSKNALWIWSGNTQVAHGGLKAGRRIQFTDADMKALEKTFADDIDHVSGRFHLWGNAAVTYQKEYGNFSLEGVMPDFKHIQTVEMKEGRYINEPDIRDFRKVALMSVAVQKALFKEETPLGKYIRVGGVPFMVVGTFENPSNKDEKQLYLPLSTIRKVFNGSNKLGEMAVSTNALTVAENKRIEEGIRSTLAQRHHVAPDDKQALGIWNTLEHFKQAQGIFAGIRLFVWVIGIMTILAGIVGVSNIMIILVKERTKEIGIRKAIGATPWSVIRLVLSESVFITTIAGFIGLVAGMGLLAIVSNVLKGMAAQGNDIERQFFNPSADWGVAISALVILVLAGLIAGYIPARRAAAIKPIEALHDE
ncbi:putative ABC transport system permease protein [Breznakibacter xylanolyticus]|uniref:Putative ABC transport system permease protein n=1 Tax=Breznakibacter xylanolyticus TaxID=990 RepID=A0A2W7MRM6_9BACT|nr:ABC transporter permease [Breznakibacter xylanolyticus]PZX10825.1 putative ABC transport system permease protein [Breznakibacter xylanolyticus]